MPDLKDFEGALLKRLSKGDIDKTFLRSTSASIMNLKKQGLVIDQVYVKGRPRFDRVIINGIIDPEIFGKIRNWGFEMSRFEVFPYGIINPEAFKFNATFEL